MLLLYYIDIIGGVKCTVEWKEAIKKMVDNINEEHLLKRIYNLVSYIYIHKAGK
jgi:hypothetical protein